MPHQTSYNIVSVGSANVIPGDGLSTRAWESIRRIIGKYFSPMNSTSVHFGQAGNGCRCTITKQIGACQRRAELPAIRTSISSYDTALAKAAADSLRQASAA
jgi:hypothetical protein